MELRSLPSRRFALFRSDGIRSTRRLPERLVSRRALQDERWLLCTTRSNRQEPDRQRRSRRHSVCSSSGTLIRSASTAYCAACTGWMTRECPTATKVVARGCALQAMLAPSTATLIAIATKRARERSAPLTCADRFCANRDERVRFGWDNANIVARSPQSGHSHRRSPRRERTRRTRATRPSFGPGSSQPKNPARSSSSRISCRGPSKFESFAS